MTPDAMRINMAEPVTFAPEPTNISGWNGTFIKPFFETYFFLLKCKSHIISPSFGEFIRL